MDDIMDVGHTVARAIEAVGLGMQVTGSGGPVDGSMYEVHVDTEIGPMTLTITPDEVRDAPRPSLLPPAPV